MNNPEPMNNQVPEEARNMELPPNEGKGFSIAALVLGICGIVLGWISVVNFIVTPCAILGVIFGVIGRKRSIAMNGKASGMATAGLVLGIIGCAFAALGLLCTIACVGCSACSTCAAGNAFNSVMNSYY